MLRAAPPSGLSPFGWPLHVPVDLVRADGGVPVSRPARPGGHREPPDDGPHARPRTAACRCRPPQPWRVWRDALQVATQIGPELHLEGHDRYPAAAERRRAGVFLRDPTHYNRCLLRAAAVLADRGFRLPIVVPARAAAVPSADCRHRRRSCNEARRDRGWVGRRRSRSHRPRAELPYLHAGSVGDAWWFEDHRLRRRDDDGSADHRCEGTGCAGIYAISLHGAASRVAAVDG